MVVWGGRQSGNEICQHLRVFIDPDNLDHSRKFFASMLLRVIGTYGMTFNKMDLNEEFTSDAINISI